MKSNLRRSGRPAGSWKERLPVLPRGLAGHLDLLLPCQAEVDLYSDKLGLSGRLDRLAPGSTPSTHPHWQSAAEDGIWKRDRLMLAGYALLLGEKHKTHINQGQVEYPAPGPGAGC